MLPSLNAPVWPTCSQGSHFSHSVLSRCSAPLSVLALTCLPAGYVLTVCRVSNLLGVSCPRSLRLCGPRALNSFLLSQLDITLRTPLTTRTLTCLPVWYVHTSCVMHLDCSAYPVLAHCICARMCSSFVTNRCHTSVVLSSLSVLVFLACHALRIMCDTFCVRR